MPFRLLILCLATCLSLTSVWAETEQRNAFCPVEPTEAALPKYSAKLGDKTFYFCCAECVEMFEADPSAYVDASDLQPDKSRGAFQVWFDGVWNACVQVPGITLGGLAVLALVILRVSVPKLRPFLGGKTFVAVVATSLGAEALSAHLLRKQLKREYEEQDLIHQVHFSTFHEYGHPPIPAKPDVPPRVQATFYRGNDERSLQLYNRGYYRTCDFNLDLCNGAGDQIGYGDELDVSDAYLRIRVVRAPGTPDFFWKPDRMKNIFVSRSSDKLLGRNGKPVADAVPMTEIRPMWEWEIRYPLEPFRKSSSSDAVRGIVYHCEKRFGSDKAQIGSRFHYAFQFDLSIEDGKLAEGSDLWMGATYRNRALRIWEIPQNEWLSTEPIPVIEGENLTTDPKLLGIEGHVLDKN